jgi:hypothetical protein
MDFIQIRNIINESTGPGGSGGGPNKKLLMLGFVCVYVVSELVRKRMT